MVTAKKTETGGATPAIAVSIVWVVILIVAISIFFRILHNEQEDSAYRFGEQRDRVIKTKTACDHNTTKHQALKIWIEQQKVLKTPPPAELLVDMPCAVVVDK